MKLRLRVLALLGAPVLILGGAVAWYVLAPRTTPSTQPGLVSLDARSLAELERAFDAEKDKTRIVALLSPT